MTHHIHPDPAVRALVERAKAEERERIAQAIETDPSVRLGHNVSVVCSCLRCEVAHAAARIARADSLAAQPAPEGATVEEVAEVYRGRLYHRDGSHSPVERWVRAANGDWISLDSERRTNRDIILEPESGDSDA